MSLKRKHDVAPTVSFICKHGNATVYQLRTGEIPPVSTMKDKAYIKVLDPIYLSLPPFEKFLELFSRLAQI